MKNRKCNIAAAAMKEMTPDSHHCFARVYRMNQRRFRTVNTVIGMLAISRIVVGNINGRSSGG